MEKIEKRRSFLVNLLFFAVIFALVYLFMNYAFWTVAPFLLALAIAAGLQRPLKFITSRTPLKKGFVTVVLQLVVLALLFGPIALLVIKLINEFRGFFDYLQIKLSDLPSFLNEIREFIVSKTPASFKTTVNSSLLSSFDSLQASLSGAASNAATIGDSSVGDSSLSLGGLDFSGFASPIKGIWNTAKHVPSAVLSIIVAFIAGCFVTMDYDSLKEFIARQLSPERRETAFKAKKAIKFCLGKMGKAYAILMTITFCEMFIALTIFRLTGIYSGSYVFVIALVTAIVDILPVLGTGTIVIPWAVISLFTGDIKMGIALFILYGVITVLRQFLEPKLVSGQLGLPPFVTIVAMFFGAKLFGFIGLFLLPITIIVLKILNDEGSIHLWTPSPQDIEAIEETNSQAEKNAKQGKKKLPKIKKKK